MQLIDMGVLQSFYIHGLIENALGGLDMIDVISERIERREPSILL